MTIGELKNRIDDIPENRYDYQVFDIDRLPLSDIDIDSDSREIVLSFDD